jgi:carotenoid cleavage dioxygenase
MNGYEDDHGRVVLDVVRHSKMFDIDMTGPSEGASSLDCWLIDPGSTVVSEHQIDDRSQEFPRFDERRTGKSYRFGYTAGVGYDDALGGIKKHDLEQETGEIHNEGEDRFFLEPVFVATSEQAAEDDGWILSYVYDHSTDRSDVVIFHAEDFSGKPEATIHLPQRVPFGFRGNWLPDTN